MATMSSSVSQSLSDTTNEAISNIRAASQSSTDINDVELFAKLIKKAEDAAQAAL